MPGDPTEEGLKLKEICDRLAVDYDDARYLLAKGVLPKVFVQEPGRGNHRQFSRSQAFLLAVVLKLRSVGVNSAIAMEIAEWARKMQEMAVNGGWDWPFAPFAGNLRSKHQWYLEIGDAQYARIVTDANPSKQGLDVPHWTDMRKRREQKDARPAVVFRIDIVRIAQLLACESRHDTSPD